MENKIRSTLNEIYFGKTRDIVNGLRSVQPLAEAKKTKDLQVRVIYQLAMLQKFFNCVPLELSKHKTSPKFIDPAGTSLFFRSWDGI